MTVLVLVILAVIWAAVLVPPMWRSRAEGRPADSISQFHRHLHVLNRTTPKGVAPIAAGPVAAYAPVPGVIPVTRSRGLRAADFQRRRTRERRRMVLGTLAGVAVATLVLGILPGLRPLLLVHLLADMLLGTYVMVLTRLRAMAQERDKLSYLPRHTASPAYASDSWSDLSAAFGRVAVQ